MREYKTIFLSFIKNMKYVLPVLLVAIAGFGYLLTHATINIDVLSAERYFEETELIAQSRLMAPIIEKIFNVMDYSPFFVDFLAVIFMVIAATLFCTLFHRIVGKKINNIAYTIFSCLFISYPLMMEAFTYTPLSLSIALAFNFVALSLMFAFEYIKSNKNFQLILSIILVWAAISLYESFATVYIMGTIAIILIKVLYVYKEKIKLRKHIIEGIKYLIPLILAILLNTIVTNFILIIFDIKQSTNAAKNIMYIELGWANGIKNLISSVIINYDINALGYLPITVLLISRVISFIMGSTLSIKKKDASIIILMLAMNVTLLSLSIIQGQAAIYRTCQQFQLFIAVIFMIMIQIVLDSKMKKWLKNTVIIITCLIIFYQTKDLYHWQYINDLRFQKEQQDVIAIGNEIVSKYDYENKPVVFVGKYNMPTNVRKYVWVKPDSIHYKVLDYYNTNFNYNKISNLQTYQFTQSNIQSYIDWSITAFINQHTPNVETIKYFNLLGYDIKLCDKKMFVEAWKSSYNKPKWPKEGSIYETEKYIVVNF